MPPSEITSRHNPRIKQAAALRNRKQRDERGETLVYGARESVRALECGASLRSVFVCRELLPSAEARDAADQLEKAAGEALWVSAEVFERIAYGDRYDGVVSVVAARQIGLGDLDLGGESPLIVVVEGVEKPGNLGAMLRTADAVGVDAVVVADAVIDLFNPNVIRASVATAFKPNIAAATSQEALDWLTAMNARVFAARPDAQQEYWREDLSGACAIVLGAESSGLTDLWRPPSVTAISLPMLGVGDSLNVSVTAAVLLYEARRQRA